MDIVNDVVVCVPHTPDPVLFGIRGENPAWVMAARQHILSEPHGIEQLYVTNQGTDAHLLPGKTGHLSELLSYVVPGVVTDMPKTKAGGHVSFTMKDEDFEVRCMAYEPTKNFRHIIRQLVPGDSVIAVGSFKKGSINLEKIQIVSLARPTITRPPLCPACNKRMTSDGKGKGWKCKKCDSRSMEPEIEEIPRTLKTGWYEVPSLLRDDTWLNLCAVESRNSKAQFLYRELLSM